MDNILSKHSGQMIKAALFFVFFATIFSVSTAFASGTPEVTPELTDTVTNLTNKHANKDYGQQIINWIAFGKPDNVKFGDTSLLSTISFTLNAIALVMMAYLSLLGGLTYIIQTANKGTPGGQVVSSFWMPIRIATATILLVPLASGYSTIQYGVITIAEKGSAHGSYLMDQGIDYIAKNGVYRPPMMESSSEVVLGLIFSEVCRSHIIKTEQRPAAITIKRSTDFSSINNENLSFSYDKVPPPVDGKGFMAFIKKLTSSNKRGYCGVLTLTSPDADRGSFVNGTAAKTSLRVFSVADYEDDAAILATSNLIKYLEDTVVPAARVIAEKLNVDGDALAELQKTGSKEAQSTYERNQKAAEKAPVTLADEINKLISNYDKKMQQILQEAVMKINKHNTSKHTGSSTTDKKSAGTPLWVEQVKSVGWPALGTVFWQISKNQEAVNYLAKRMKATYTQPNLDKQYNEDERFLTLYERLADLTAQTKIQKRENNSHIYDMKSIEMSGADASVGQIKTYITGAFQGLMLSMFIPDDDGDLITKLQYSGSVLASTTDLMMHSAIWLKATGETGAITADQAHRALTASATAAPLGLGMLTGAAAGVAGGVAAAAATYLGRVAYQYGTYMSTLVIPLLVAGFTLAVVLPAIPLFFWLMGVVSWMMFFVECLLVSPMWLAAHGTAEKEGWGSEHTRQGYMLMIGLYLNPILRVAGFFAIFLVLIPLGRMVGWLSEYLTGVLASGWLSPALIVGSMVILAVFAYSAAVRVFSLPNELFERGLRWINGGQEVTGDSSAEQQNRTIIASVGGKADGAASAARHLGRGGPAPNAAATQAPK